MKTFFKTVLCLSFACASCTSWSQTGRSYAGIYVTQADFENNNLSLLADDQSPNAVKRLYNETLVIVRGEKVYEFPFGTLAGYYSMPAKYRAFQQKGLIGSHGYFKIESVGRIIIYSKPGIYKTANTMFYYYSLTTTSPILRLTYKNLMRDLKDDPLAIQQLKSGRKQINASEQWYLEINRLLTKSHG